MLDYLISLISSETEVYKEFASEDINNIHVKAIDLKVPLISIIKVGISDIICAQLTESLSTEGKYRIFPRTIRIVNISDNQFAEIQFKNTNWVLDFLLNTVWPKDHSSKKRDPINKKIEQFRHNLFFHNELLIPVCDQFVSDNKWDKKDPSPIKNTFRVSEVFGGYQLIVDYNSYKCSTKRGGVEFSEGDPNGDNDTLKGIHKRFLTKVLVLSTFTKKNKDNYEKIKTQATLNAIANVMARNMSHNIGSHVLSRMVSPEDIDIKTITEGDDPFYKSVALRIQNEKDDKEELLFDSLKNTIKKETTKYCKKGEKEEAAEKLATRDYYNNLLATFLSYLETRQSFIADIVSGTPSIQSTKSISSEIMKGFDQNRLLLNRISGVGDFYYRLVLELPEKDIPIAISNDILGQHAFYIILENLIRNTAKHGSNNRKEDNSGLHTFFIRIQESKLDSSHFSVVVFDDSEFDKGKDSLFYLKIKISDFDRALKKREWKKPPPDLSLDPPKEQEYRLEDRPQWISGLVDRLVLPEDIIEKPDFLPELNYIKDDTNFLYFSIDRLHHLILSQNNWINTEILDENFRLRSQALGLIEMEACAAYLRKKPIEEIELPENQIKFSINEINQSKEKIKNGGKGLPFLRAVRPYIEYGNPESGRKRVLGYKFYIPKPKELLIIDESGEIWNELEEKYAGKTKEELVQGIKEKLAEFEKHGILLLRSFLFNNLESTTKEKKDKITQWKEDFGKWEFDVSETYPHELLLYYPGREDENLGSWECFKEKFQNQKKENERPNYQSSLLPNRKIHKDQFQSCFLDYSGIQPKLYKGVFSKESPSITDFLENPKLLKLEAWRAYAHNRYLVKQLSCWKPWFFPPQNIFEEFKPFYDKHGTRYLVNQATYSNTYINILESRYGALRDKQKPKTGKLLENLAFLKGTDELLSNVLILDERVQEYVYRNKYDTEGGGKFPIAQMWDECNVFIPVPSETKSYDRTNTNAITKKGKKEKKHITIPESPYEMDIYLDLNQTKYDDDFDDNIKRIIEERFLKCKKKITGLDYLVIHLGVVEKILEAKGENKSVEENVTKLIHSFFKFDNPEYPSDAFSNLKIIITSGRAPRAANLPAVFSFLPFSVISQFTIENRFKYLLIEALASARKKTN